MDLRDRVALVTGASGGLGAVTAGMLADHGVAADHRILPIRRGDGPNPSHRRGGCVSLRVKTP
jgi:NAD(P)-dependent dehydrogenase (short-subunit alcohol dehydrogenase family)